MNQQIQQNKGASAATGALSSAASGAVLGSAVPGIGTAIGAVVGGLIGGVSGYLKADTKTAVKQSLAVGPGDPNAGMKEGELGKDYSFSEYQKSLEPSGFEKGLGIANTTLQTAAALYGSVQGLGVKPEVSGALTKATTGAVDTTVNIANASHAPITLGSNPNSLLSGLNSF